MTTRAVAVHGLHKSFGAEPVLRGLDLHVPDGSLTAILAPSGSGKTTLLRLIAGFETPDQGTVAIGETIVSGGGRELGPAARQVGYVPQEGALFPHLDVAANVGFGLQRRARRRRVPELLELVGLPHLAGRFPHQLSGGEQQRVALARALAPGPLVMLLDEPFSSLDASLRASVRGELTAILAGARTTTIIVTHDQDEALSMADQIVVLREGVVGQAGPPREVYARPADPALAHLVGTANFLAGTVRAGRVQTALGSLALVDGAAAPVDDVAVTVLLRPEQIRLDGGNGTVGTTVHERGATGVVLRCEYHGHDLVAVVEVAALAAPAAVPVPATPGVPATLSVRSPGAAALAPGTRVALSAEGPVMAWPAGSARSVP